MDRPPGGAPAASRLISKETPIPLAPLAWLPRLRRAPLHERDTDPLHAELFSIEQLKRHAAALMAQARLEAQPGPDRLLPRLADNERALRAAYAVVTAAAPGQRIAPAEAWLLDNFYLIEQQITLARRHLPRGYSRQLPRLANGPQAGFPRIYELALELISHMDGRIDADNVHAFIAAGQTVSPLRIGELWAFPIMLQLALLENLRRVAVRIASRRAERDAAIAWADRMLATAEDEPKRLIQLLAEFAHADVPLTAPFVEEFYARLQAQGPAMGFVQTWVEHQLSQQGVTATELAEAAGRAAAANQISIANSIGSLRFIGQMDWRALVETHSVVEQCLRRDPAQVHAGQDFATRDRYRHIVEDIARQDVRGLGEHAELAVAEAAVVLAEAAARQYGTDDRRAHVGYFLLDRGRPVLEQTLHCRPAWPIRLARLRRRFRLALYLGPIVGLTALLTAAALWAGAAPGWFALPLALGTSALAVALTNLLVTLTVPPRVLPRLDFSTGIPHAHRTMVIVPTLLGRPEEIDRLVEALEIRYLGNRDPNLFFALLTDFPDAPSETLPDDAARVAHARAAVEALNARYRDERSGAFYLFHRPRRWNPVERVWMGVERKRGKLEEFNARLRGGTPDAFSEIVGDPEMLGSIRYVITLDTDTQLPRDAARTLVGNLAHPLNRPLYDAACGRIVEGYAVLQPRASISLASAGQSRFARLFAGDSGLDPYTREISDVYQDLFGEGSFIGKGIYDVDAFRLAVDGRFPDNLILSHDLLEGGYARAALVSDVELIEEHPASVAQDASRRHRWIRGDWQLARWLLPRVPAGPALSNPAPPNPPPDSPAAAPGGSQRNPLSALSRWKLCDNLRRSLVAPALVALLVGGWLAGPGWGWTLLVVAIVGVPALVSALVAIVRKPDERTWFAHLDLTTRATRRPFAHAALALAFLPYDAWIALAAIARSGGRMLFTRRGLLLWQLPSYARRNARRTAGDFAAEMAAGPLLAGAVALLWAGNLALAGVAPPPAGLASLAAAAPVLLLWLISPLLGWWISRPLAPAPPDLDPAQCAFLRATARRTWRYFAEFTSPEHHWLAPDNMQENPGREVAARTSPTNMGMGLLAELAAVDFGFQSAGECLHRVGETLATMATLDRYRGHFYNWYDTRTLQVLSPHYVSSVDSGNLAGCLLALHAGLLELKHLPLVSSASFVGLQDSLRVLAEQCSHNPDPAVVARIAALDARLRRFASDTTTPHMAAGALNEVVRVADELAALLAPNGDPDAQWPVWAQAFARQAHACRDELAAFVPEPQRYTTMPTPASLAEASDPAALADPYGPAQLARARLARIDELAAQCRALAAMAFEFLYDPASHLLAIGYDVGERRRDPACYDLLASEARLASFLLIAQGQLPQKHWFALGRLLTRHGGEVSLISWSGSMFEYLMPQLLLPSYPDTLLAQTCRAAVARQIDYGRQRGVPWGISESCYNATDAQQIYQYRAFGVPGLGFKRGLSDDLVIAPYASALALTALPQAACRNLMALAEAGFLGDYGFYEAIDYTPSRVPRGKPHAVVHAFMAHHQGMSLLALAQVLLGQPMQRRLLADPEVRATELLLQERVPKSGATLHPHAAEASDARPPVASDAAIVRVFSNPDTPTPEVHLLSNGRYHVMATHAGGSFSRWSDLAVTRWREDATADDWGVFVYLRDRDSGVVWSGTHQPTRQPADHYEAIFVQGRAEYRRRDQAIETHTELCVSPEDDVEIRRVTLTNQSSRSRRIELTSYAEVVIAPHHSDLAHRAFSNLFVQTELLPERQAILCTRRPRTAGEPVAWMFHLLAAPGASCDAPSFETDRARFVGRGRSAANPQALDSAGLDRHAAAPLSNTAGAVLDPVVAIRRTLALAADETASVQIVTGIADSREAALALLDKYCDRHFVERAFEMAWFQSQEVLRHLNATEADAQVYGRLASSVVFSTALRRAAPEVIARNRLGQSGLWRFAISGDLPVVLLHIGHLDRIELVRQVLQAHAYWRMKGLAVDLVIVNEDFSGYRATLSEQILALIHAGPEAHALDQPGGVFVRRADELTEDERVLFQTVARIVFSDHADTLIEQVERRVSGERVSDRFEPTQAASDAAVVPLAPRKRVFDNGLGGFTPDGREYVIALEPGQSTPAPWVNVIASPHLGTVVSERGSAYTWAGNAHEFRLTPWHNDTVGDRSGEAFYLRDEETGAFWSPTPAPAAGRGGTVCRHGFGYSAFERLEAGIASELFVYVAMDAPLKFAVLKLKNTGKRTRSVSATGYWELVLGEWRHSNLMHIVTETDPHSGALFARNPYGRECAQRVVFAHVHGGAPDTRSVSGNRAEFIGRNGTLAAPAAMRRKRLSGRVGAGYDPCLALQTRIELAAGQEREIVFVFGAAASTDAARELIQNYGGRAGARQALEAVWQYWNHTLGAVNVETPDPALDLLANGWLLYQTISCRLWARSGNYQSGGAFGFRDQLQDTLALLHASPWLAREQLVRCAGRQFAQGDVQHWWHPPGGQGVRTHFSDDYLWLPYVACRYVRATGDTGVLDEAVHFLEGRALNPEEEAYYDQPQASAEAASVYEHCARAIRHGLRFGVHQLPLIGCGDWNDGMNLVGSAGRGESVWLGWFLFENLELFADLALSRNDAEFAATCRAAAATLRLNLEAHAWDGAWYRRAYFDDGTPLGSAQNDECQIDSISQSWAVLSGGGDPARARQAMDAVDQRLVERDARLIRLLDPPFDRGVLEPGYIKGYVPGVRENGGQYTHAAIWTVAAFARLGDTTRAWELFDLLNPVHHGGTPAAIAHYKVEPYVMCADIYGAAPHTGRGGWTWYTGAAGWMYRLAVETLLGLNLDIDHLRIAPCLPADWPQFTIHYRYRETVHHLRIVRGADNPQQPIRGTLDGVALAAGGVDATGRPQIRVPLADDRREHRVEIEVS